MVHHWGKYELRTGRASAALQEAKVPLEEKKAEQLKQGAGVGQWDQGPGCVCLQASSLVPLLVFAQLSGRSQPVPAVPGERRNKTFQFWGRLAWWQLQHQSKGKAPG